MPRLYQLRSLVALTRGDYQRALAEAEAMVELDPNSAESHFALGRIYFYTAEYESAIDRFEMAERLDPHSRGGYAAHRALAQLALGRADLAVSIMETVLERWPDYQGSRLFLTIAYQLAGRHAEARQQAALLPRGDQGTAMLAVERIFSTMQDREFASRVIAAARQAGIPD
jgi:tetratricopeptide (TPR) repeat protein